MIRTYIFKRLAAIFLGFMICVAAYAQNHRTTFRLTETVSVDTRRKMENNANALFAEINMAYSQKKPELRLSTDNATPEAIRRINNMWAFDKFYCSVTQVSQRVLAKHNSGELRVMKIPAFFERENAPYELALDFTPDGKISDILTNKPIPIKIDMDVKELTVITLVEGFLKNFFTAYHKKDLDYIGKVFSADALIIVGFTLVPIPNRPDNAPSIPMDNEYVEYITVSRKEYMERLTRIFANNEEIWIDYSDITIKGIGKEHHYGVMLRQKYHSSTYSDDGWLFLQIDMSDNDKPMIWARVWQDYYNYRFNPWDILFVR